MRLARIVSALALLVAATGALCAQDRDSLIVHYTDGVRLATMGEGEAALEKFEKALAIDPGHAPSLYEAANALIAADENEKALEYSSRAAEIDPENHWYEGQRARLLAATERYGPAVEAAEKMVRERAFEPENYRLLALLYYQQARIDEALATLDSAEIRMGLTPELVDMKRGMLLDVDRVDEAAAVTERYVEANPYDEDNRLSLAAIYAYRGQAEARRRVLEEVIAINPDNDTALEALAGYHLMRGQGAMYLATLKQFFSLPGVALDRKTRLLENVTRNTNLYRAHYFEVGELVLMLLTGHGDDPEVAELYADHAMRGGDSDGALTILKSALERPSARLETFLKTIEIEAYLQRVDSVGVWSDRALRRFPDEVSIYLMHSGALQYTGRNKEALKVLAQGLKVARTDSLRSEVYGSIGTLHHEEGNLKKTFAAYEQALAANPDNALVLNNYAYYLALEEKQLDRALGMAQRAVRLQENVATYLDTYAWVLYKTGDYAGARRIMQQALPLDREGSAELMIHYGDILWALGENYMASVYWRRAREAGWEPVAEIEERLSRLQ